MRHVSIRSTTAQMPLLGMGTWKVPPKTVCNTIREAVQVGYRAFDCAAAYRNEAEIGKALTSVYRQEGNPRVQREDLWLTAKLWNSEHAPKDVKPALLKTLQDLQTSYVDLYLMHWPVAFVRGASFPPKAEEMISLEDLPLADTWAAMEACLKEGLTRHIGVCNFSLGKLQMLLENSEIAPQVNQIEIHPFLPQESLVQFCFHHDMTVMGYSSLGSMDRPAILKACDEPILLSHPTIVALAQAKQITPAQLLLAWSMQRGIAVIPKSTNPQRMRENWAAQHVVLTKDEMHSLASLDRHCRYVDGSFFTP